jgi:hypothetical protein
MGITLAAEFVGSMGMPGNRLVFLISDVDRWFILKGEFHETDYQEHVPS